MNVLGRLCVSLVLSAVHGTCNAVTLTVTDPIAAGARVVNLGAAIASTDQWKLDIADDSEEWDLWISLAKSWGFDAMLPSQLTLSLSGSSTSNSDMLISFTDGLENATSKSFTMHVPLDDNGNIQISPGCDTNILDPSQKLHSGDPYPTMTTTAGSSVPPGSRKCRPAYINASVSCPYDNIASAANASSWPITFTIDNYPSQNRVVVTFEATGVSPVSCAFADSMIANTGHAIYLTTPIQQDGYYISAISVEYGLIPTPEPTTPDPTSPSSKPSLSPSVTPSPPPSMSPSSTPSFSPTTFSPTTSSPTTFSPTTSTPTSSSPSNAPTTLSPTTSDPTTASPSIAPVTASPTTSTPTTHAPTTLTPTTPPTKSIIIEISTAKPTKSDDDAEVEIPSTTPENDDKGNVDFSSDEALDTNSILMIVIIVLLSSILCCCLTVFAFKLKYFYQVRAKYAAYVKYVQHNDDPALRQPMMPKLDHSVQPPNAFNYHANAFNPGQPGNAKESVSASAQHSEGGGLTVPYHIADANNENLNHVRHRNDVQTSQQVCEQDDEDDDDAVIDGELGTGMNTKDQDRNEQVQEAYIDGLVQQAQPPAIRLSELKHGKYGHDGESENEAEDPHEFVVRDEDETSVGIEHKLNDQDDYDEGADAVKDGVMESAVLREDAEVEVQRNDIHTEMQKKGKRQRKGESRKKSHSASKSFVISSEDEETAK